MEKAYQVFARWGFGAIVIPALLPPPMPMVPFLIAAGIMQYSKKKFLSALMLGRILRYSVLAFLGAYYGRRILAVTAQHRLPILFVASALVISIGAALAIFRTKTQARRTCKGALGGRTSHPKMPFSFAHKSRCS